MILKSETAENSIFKIQVARLAHLVSQTGHIKENYLINLESWGTGLKRKLTNWRAYFHAFQHISKWLWKIKLIGIGEMIER